MFDEVIKQLPKGAFLVTGEKSNPMTIGWAQFGVIWGKPVLTVLVRHSRYTHSLIESGRFNVSVPAFGTMAEELKICGTLSGKDTDKLSRAGLKVVPSQTGGPGCIAECAYHFECKTLLKSEASIEDLREDLLSHYYSGDDKGNYHTLYFGEILKAYPEVRNL